MFFFHVEALVDGILHHESRNHSEAAKGSEPLVDHVVCEEARVICEVHGLGSHEVSFLKYLGDLALFFTAELLESGITGEWHLLVIRRGPL